MVPMCCLCSCALNTYINYHMQGILQDMQLREEVSRIINNSAGNVRASLEQFANSEQHELARLAGKFPPVSCLDAFFSALPAVSNLSCLLFMQRGCWMHWANSLRGWFLMRLWGMASRQLHRQQCLQRVERVALEVVWAQFSDTVTHAKAHHQMLDLSQTAWTWTTKTRS